MADGDFAVRTVDDPASVGHANHGNPEVMLALSQWVQSILTLSPRPELLDGVDGVFKFHMFLGMTVFLLFPFTRLVHPDGALQLSGAFLSGGADEASGLRTIRLL